MRKSFGFTMIEVLVVIVALVLFGLVAFNLYSLQVANQESIEQQQAAASAAPDAPEIVETSDLDTATSVLDQIDPGSIDQDLTSLDEETAF